MKNPFKFLTPGRVPEIDDDSHEDGAQTPPRGRRHAADAVLPRSDVARRLPEMTPDSHVTATSLDTVLPGTIDAPLSGEMRHNLIDIDQALLAGRRPNRAQLRTMAAAVIQRMPQELQRELNFDDRRRHVIEGLADVMERFIATQPEHDAEATDQELQRVTSQMIEVLFGDHVDTLVHGPLVARPNSTAREDAHITSGHRSALVGKRVTELVLWVFSAYTTLLGVRHYAGVGMERFERLIGYDFPNLVQEWLRYGIGLTVAVIISQTVIGIKHAVENIANTEGVNLIGGGGKKGAYRRYMGREWQGHKAHTLWLVMILLVDGLTNMSGVVTSVGRRRDMDKQIAELTGQIDAWKVQLANETKDLDGRYAEPLEATAQTDLDKEAEGEAASKAKGHGPIWDAKNWLYDESADSRNRLRDRTGSHARDLYAAVERSPLSNDGKPLSEDVRGRVAAALAKVQELLGEADKMRGELDPALSEEQLQERFDRIQAVLNGILPILNKDLPDELRGQVANYAEVQKAILEIVKRQYPNADPRIFEPLTVENIDLQEIKLKLGKIEFRGVWDLIQSAFADQPEFIKGLLLAIAVAIGIGLSQGDQLFIRGTRKAYNEDAVRAARVRAGLLEPLMENIARVIARLMSVGPYARFFKDCEVHPRVVLAEIKKRVEELADPEKKDDYPAVIGFLREKGLFPAYWATTKFADEHNRRVEALLHIADSPEEMNLIIKRLLPANELLESANPNADVTGRVAEENTAHLAERNNVAYRDVISEAVRYTGELSDNLSVNFSPDDFDYALKEVDILYDVLESIGNSAHLETHTSRALSDADTFLEEIDSRIFDRRFASIASESLALAHRDSLSAADLDRALARADQFAGECVALEGDMTPASRERLNDALQSLDRARVDLFTLRFRTIQNIATNDHHAQRSMSPDDIADARRALGDLARECTELEGHIPAQCRDILGTTRDVIMRQQNELDACRLDQILERCITARETLRSDRASLADADAIAAQHRIDHGFVSPLQTTNPVTIGLCTRALVELGFVSARVQAVRDAHAEHELRHILPDHAVRVEEVGRDARHARLINGFAEWSRDYDAVPRDADIPPALISRFASLTGVDGASLILTNADGNDLPIPSEAAQRMTDGIGEFMTVVRGQITHPTLSLDRALDLERLRATVEEFFGNFRTSHFPAATPRNP